MSWEKHVEELNHRKALALKMGGEEKVERQLSRGKKTVRERIDGLVDPGTFKEVGSISGWAQYDDKGKLTDFMAANFIFGRAKINGQTVVATGDDFTVRGGAADAAIAGKMGAAEKFALDYRLPIVRMIDGTGGGGSVKTLDGSGRTYIPQNPGWEIVVENLATVPVVALALGPVAGLGSARVVTSHFSVMVKELSQLFIAGPVVVSRVDDDLTKEELGGSDIHARAGAVDLVVKTEEEAFEAAAKFLSFLPNSVYELPPRAEPTDDPERRDDWLIDAIPEDRRKVYKMRKIIKFLVDDGDFMEMGKVYGQSLITGLCRLDGWPVALMAGDPYHYGGAWTADASIKATRFLDLAETFHLPIVHLVDNPGFLIGLKAETEGTIKHGSRALAAVYQTNVPMCSIMVRKCFGVAGAAHTNHAKARFRYAWPSGDWGSLPMEGGIEAAFKSDLEASDDPDALLKEIQDRMEAVRSPFRTAEAFLVEEMIDPRDTRSLLCEFANLAAPLRTPGPSGLKFRL